MADRLPCKVRWVRDSGLGYLHAMVELEDSSTIIVNLPPSQAPAVGTKGQVTQEGDAWRFEPT